MNPTPITNFPQMEVRQMPMTCIADHLPEEARDLFVRAWAALELHVQGRLGKKMPEISVAVDTVLYLLANIVAMGYMDGVVIRMIHAVKALESGAADSIQTAFYSLEDARIHGSQGVGHLHTWVMPVSLATEDLWPKYDCTKDLVLRLMAGEQPEPTTTDSDNITEFPKDAGVRERTVYPSKESEE